MKKSKKIIPYGRQELKKQDIDAVLRVLRSDVWTQGPAVEKFEKKFAKVVGAKYGVAVANGTAALHLACMALNIGPGDRVLVPAISFAASSNCVLYMGANVEFVDIDPETYCISNAHLSEKLRAHPLGYYKALIVVDMAGYPSMNGEIKKLTQEFNLPIIEDACHAPGARWKDQTWHKVGSGTDAVLSVFSFHPVKHVASGEGGMITTSDEKIAARIKLLRSHGIEKNPKAFSKISHGPWYMEMQELGFNYRLPDILCALGESQLSRLKQNLKRRNQIAKIYDKAFSDLELQLPKRTKNIYHAFHLYVVLTTKRRDLFEYLKSKNIYCQVHYIPIYQHPHYEKLYGSLKLPNAEKYYQKAISLPMYPSLSNKDLDFVISSVRRFFGKK